MYYAAPDSMFGFLLFAETTNLKFSMLLTYLDIICETLSDVKRCEVEGDGFSPCYGCQTATRFLTKAVEPRNAVQKTGPEMETLMGSQCAFVVHAQYFLFLMLSETVALYKTFRFFGREEETKV